MALSLVLFEWVFFVFNLNGDPFGLIELSRRLLLYGLSFGLFAVDDLVNNPFQTLIMFMHCLH